MTDKRMPWWGPHTVPRAALDHGGLNWEVKKAPLLAEIRKGTHKPVEGNFALVQAVAGGAVLGVVGERYEPRQNADLLKWAQGFGRLIGSWSMDNERVVGFTVSQVDAVVDYVHVLNHHSGGGIEVHAAIETPDRVSFIFPTVHVRSLKEEPSAVLDTVNALLSTVHPDIDRLRKRTASPKDVSALYEALWRRPAASAGPKAQSRWKNRKDEIWTAWQESDDDSMWGALMALLEWAQWRRNFRGSAADPTENDRLRGEEILFGPTREISDKAFRYLKAKR